MATAKRTSLSTTRSRSLLRFWIGLIALVGQFVFSAAHARGPASDAYGVLMCTAAGYVEVLVSDTPDSAPAGDAKAFSKACPVCGFAGGGALPPPDMAGVGLPEFTGTQIRLRATALAVASRTDTAAYGSRAPPVLI
jgi:hypothetical protein